MSSLEDIVNWQEGAKPYYESDHSLKYDSEPKRKYYGGKESDSKLGYSYPDKDDNDKFGEILIK